MKQLVINPNNERFYSEDFIKGFKCGTQRQLEADKKDRPQGEWIDGGLEFEDYECSECGYITEKFGGKYLYNYCPWCGADMKGSDDEAN